MSEKQLKRQLQIKFILAVAVIINQMVVGDYTRNISFYIMTLYLILTIPSFIRYITKDY